MRPLLLAALSALAAASGAGLVGEPAWSQPVSPSAETASRAAAPMDGTVVAFTGAVLKVKNAHGVVTSYTVADDARYLRLTKIDASAIKPGSFVATANVSQPDGSGVSKEFRVFAPALKGLGEGHGPMAGEAPGTMMTNGTVSAEVVSTPRGREMDVTYGGNGAQGVRHIVLPPNVTIREMSLVARAQIKPGIAVQVRGGQSANGSLVARAVIIGQDGRPPAS